MLKPGDRAIIIKPTACCGYTGGLGKIIEVVGLCEACSRCLQCGAIITKQPLALYGDGFGAAVNRLKKLEPPTEQEIAELVEEGAL